ncbi:Helix-turn-helix domain [[Clostridium] sordellii]|uniref:Helix-turn-helix domain n=1 Tax=Paraclostridium sordellii TaxID=1505 RepID=A0A0C7GQ80_PARSO|nr:helix-turn-helix domain-containing protein [Paeniclostridium sordellii]CEN80970.1 Helix-turn-helix domain [[Clostridium] sordellii] [Paeniclostridium sordellii]CEN84221.1 Helix-turn-helix domain [[Clostridium] sordellii] [Paeniclostridium sordellii]CEO09548.1 Helix-turn-helix domain [[Clostridium] sordellii] [Paeniclostridium sordellii]CEQ04116.1 Helix-turn-helix domain [[Clostridium] sordellii] [Paeniclostridium sordellii]
MTKKVFTAKDIQELLGVCEKTAYNLIRQAQTTGDMFKVIKIGRLYKIPSQPFLDWLDHWDGF